MDKRKKILIALSALMLACLCGVIVYFWYNGNHFVTTEDARVTGDIVKICPQATGKLIDCFIDEGKPVKKNEIVGRLEVMNLPDSSIELSLVRSPITGIVIKKQGTVGEVVQAGQTLAYVVDPDELYVIANIEETKIGRIRPGMKVDIKIDQMKDLKFSGFVENSGMASNSTFSLLPSSSGSTFTKVVQKIPVKIAFESVKKSLIITGANASVRIHLH
jgi:multidrug resistance efflux pump